MALETDAQRTRHELIRLCHRGLDVARFVEAAARPPRWRASSGRRAACARRPAGTRSAARYRELLAPKGFDDELRTAFVEGSTCWGAAAMYRARGRPC